MRAFIIGNGLSLTVEQLNKIIDRPSYACNRINLIYNETDWRPTVYVHPESTSLDTEHVRENVDLGIQCYLGGYYKDYFNAPNIKWIKACHHYMQDFTSVLLPDEWHMPQPCSFGGSVNVAMQIAVLDGFDDLVLLGCDLNYRDNKPSHFDLRYETNEEAPAFLQRHNALWGHIQAMNWLRRNRKSIRVRNATEGGLLEVWERATLDECL